MPDFIYDDQGTHIATIVNGEIRNTADKAFAKVDAAGNVYGPDGELIGHLQGDHVRKDGDTTPQPFLELLSKAKG